MITVKDKNELNERMARLCGFDDTITSEFPRLVVGRKTCWLQINENDETKDLVCWNPIEDIKQAMMVIAKMREMGWHYCLSGGPHPDPSYGDTDLANFYYIPKGQHKPKFEGRAYGTDLPYIICKAALEATR
jgi:hypothetical protein